MNENLNLKPHQTVEAILSEGHLDTAAAWLPDFWELTKPRLTFLVLVTAAVGFCMGSRGALDWLLLFHTILGTALVAGGASAFNQLLERDADAKMERTHDRPLASGRMQARDALVFGAILSAGGVLYLGVALNGLTALLGMTAWLSYVFVYTPLKRRTPLCTVVGAVPGAIPPVMGWTATGNSMDWGAWALFAILFLWQIPHFLALARMYREDYIRGGFPMLPVVDPEGSRTSRRIFLYCLALVPVSLAPCFLGLCGNLYFAGALALGIGFLGLGIRAALLRTMTSSKQLFFASIFYLPFLLMFMVANKISP